MKTLILISAFLTVVYFTGIVPTVQQNPLKDTTLTAEKENAAMNGKVIKSEEEWKKELTEEEYYVIRKKGTERAFTGKYDKFYEEGKYYCAACGNLLFDSKTKYNSGSGWPSFYDFEKEGSVETVTDYSFGMERKEIICSKCGGHLGHVFEDGPAPTGLRYCVNSVSLKFIPKKDADKD